MTNLSYIQKSATVNAAIVGKIAISSDGNTWDFLSKDNLMVGHIESGIPGLNYPYPTKLQVVLKYLHVPTYDFDIQSVKNQPTWVATPAGLKIAVEDISSW